MWSKPPSFTAEQLRQMIEYCPDTGVFTWRVSSLFSNSRNAQFGGKRAGSLEDQGYWIIGLNGRWYKAHLLAWFYMTGEWPAEQIDHRDTVRSNNVWTNLRPATNQQNQFNKGPNRNNRSGFKGVFLATNPVRNKPWMAKIHAQGKNRHLGYFHTAQEANTAYLQAAQELAGVFARAQA